MFHMNAVTLRYEQCAVHPALRTAVQGVVKQGKQDRSSGLWWMLQMYESLLGRAHELLVLSLDYHPHNDYHSMPRRALALV